MREGFVCARITQMNGVDLNRFEFDYDATWTAFLTDADLNVYSRFGGRDGGDPERRLKKSAFLDTLNEVLKLHADGSRDFQNVPAEPRTPEQIPLLRKNHQGCVHCHQIREYALLQAFHDGAFQRKELFPWPLPENLGIEPDFDHGRKIKSLQVGSPAHRAGLRFGDVILRANDAPIRAELDFRWALHKADESHPLKLRVRREIDAADPREIEIEFTPPAGWKRSDIGWRKSLRSVPFPIGMRGAPLSPSQRAELDLPAEETLAIRVLTVASRGFAPEMKLLTGDVILAVGEESPLSNFDEFRSLLLNRYEPGSNVELRVWRGGKTLSLRGKFPDWHTDETSVP